MATKGGKQLVQEILLRVRAPALPANNGLRQSVELLKQMDALLQGINQHFGSAASRMAGFSKSALNELFKVKAKKLSPSEFNKIVGFSDEQFFRHLAAYRSGHKGIVRSMFRGSDFTSTKFASEFYSWAVRQEQATVQKLLRQAGGSGAARMPGRTAGPTQAALGSGGPITLSIPASSIQAVLVGGPIPLQVPGQVAAVQAGSGSGSVGSTVKGVPSVPQGKNEIRRVTRRDKDGNVTSVKVEEALAPFHSLATTYTQKGETTSESERSAAAIRAQVNAELKAARLGFMGATAGNVGRLEKAKAFQSLAGHIQYIRATHGGRLGEVGLEHIAQELGQRAASVQSAADAAFLAAPNASGQTKMSALSRTMRRRMEATAKANARAQAEYRAEVFARQQRTLDEALAAHRSESTDAHANLTMEKSFRRQEEKRQREEEYRERQRYQAHQRAIRDRERAAKESQAAVPAWRKKWFGQSGVASFSNLGTQMASNAASVAAWGLPAFGMTAAMGAGVSVLTHATTTAVETSMQTARLSQVFRGAGGDAQQLTTDILRLASAEGRSRKEAMESAIQWSRLGLTRRETAEATRVSLLAANVAEIDALDATEKLQAVQKAYGLQVRELAGVLGMLNSISNTYNVTNAAMLDGLTRTASVAKQAGVPLAELVGLMAATIGATGQSGANVGNAMKSILVSLGNPEIQQFLNDRYGLSAMSGGKMKPGNQRLRELWSVYRGLEPEEQQNILYRVAGKTQASRMAAMMDNFVTGQILSVRSQRNLGSAEQENVKIRSELASRWTGFVSEFDAFVNAMNKASGATEMLATHLGGVSYILRMLSGLQGPGKFGNTFGGMMMQVLNGASLQTNEGRRMSLDRRLEEQKSAVEASRRLQDLYATASSMNLNKTEADMLSWEMGPETRRKYLDAYTRGDRKSQRDALIEAAVAERRSERESKAKAQALAQREMAANEQAIKVARANRDVNALAEIEARQKSLLGRSFEFHEEDLGTETQEAMTQGRANAMAGIRYRMKGIESMGFDRQSATGQLTQEVQALMRQEQMLKSEQSNPNLGADHIGDVHAMLRDVRAGIAARMGGVGFARGKDMDTIGRELVRSDLDVASVGRDQIEVLNNRIKKYTQLVDLNQRMVDLADGQVEKDKALSVNKALQAEYENLILSKVRARADAAREEYEASRRMIAMTPRQLVMQIAAQRMGGSVTPASFLAMSPEMRETLLERGDSARRKAFLADKPSFDQLLAKFSRTQELERLLSSADAAATSIGSFASKVDQAARAAQSFIDAVTSTSNAPAPAAPPPAAGPPQVPQAPQEYIRAEFPRPEVWTDWLDMRHYDRAQARANR